MTEETVTPDLSQLQEEINELRRQNESLKKKRFNVLNQSKKSSDQQKPPILQKKQSKMGLNISQSAEKQISQYKEVSITATEPIAKPNGNYINVPKTLNISNNDYNSYKSNIRDLIEAYISTEKTWEKQDKRMILKLVEKFKENNLKFPKTVGDWAIKEMLRRSINNKRGHQQKKQKKAEVFQNKKNKAVAVIRSNKAVAGKDEAVIGKGKAVVRNRNEVVASGSETNSSDDEHSLKSVVDGVVDSTDADDTMNRDYGGGHQQKKQKKAEVFQNKKNKAVVVVRSNETVVRKGKAVIGKGKAVVKNGSEVVASTNLSDNEIDKSVADDVMDFTDVDDAMNCDEVVNSTNVDDTISCDDRNRKDNDEDEDEEYEEERGGNKSKNKKGAQTQDQRKSGRISKQPRKNYNDNKAS